MPVTIRRIFALSESVRPSPPVNRRADQVQNLAITEPDHLLKAFASEPMPLLWGLLLVMATSGSVFAQSYTISTYAGGGLPVNIPGISASIGIVQGVALDATGNVFIASQTGNIVLRLDATTGILTVEAGNGTPGFSGDDGAATDAQLNVPTGLAVDSYGNLFIADQGNQRIRKISHGVITTVAGDGIPGFSGDNGPATSAQLFYPSGVVLDPTGNLYIADSLNNRIRKISNGMITTVAGDGTQGFSGDNGPATNAQLAIGAIFPSGESLAVDSIGNLYIADTGNNRIRMVSNGVISTIAGNGTFGFSGDDGPAVNAQLNLPLRVVVDSADNLYIADTGNNRIRMISNGVITTVAGNGMAGQWGMSADAGPAISAQLSPSSVAADSAGNLYVAEQWNHRVRKISNGTIATVAGNGTFWFSGDNGPATNAQFVPSGVAVDSGGNLYIADANGRVRKVADGVITTVAAGGMSASDDDGADTDAQLSDPRGVAVDSAGNLYAAEPWNHRVRKISNGVITTVAGDGTEGFSGYNGPATSAQLFFPTSIAVDSAGSLYIADNGNSRVRRVSNGVITTVAGNGTAQGDGDTGPANNSPVSPDSVAIDPAGNLYIADIRNHRIRKVSNGVITTVAGNGMAGADGDGGLATSAQLGGPSAIAVDSAGELYIADIDCNRIRKVSGGLITTIAGNGKCLFPFDQILAKKAKQRTLGANTTCCFGDSGPATSAQLNMPLGVAVDSAGNVYVADSGNNRIRLLTPPRLHVPTPAPRPPGSRSNDHRRAALINTTGNPNNSRQTVYWKRRITTRLTFRSAEGHGERPLVS